ncbi:hypothetical protein HDU97_009368 [Phlyctochytrium planicorne]|nr:hypothetical protein HDU97_009368 [Phlyctochytrium planicorne]
MELRKRTAPQTNSPRKRISDHTNPPTPSKATTITNSLICRPYDHFVVNLPTSSQQPIPLFQNRNRYFTDELGLGVGFTSASPLDIQSIPTTTKPLDIKFNPGYNGAPPRLRNLAKLLDTVVVNESKSGSDDDSYYPMPPSPPKFGGFSNGSSAEISSRTTRSVTPVTEISAAKRQPEEKSASLEKSSLSDSLELWEKLNERGLNVNATARSVTSSSSATTMAPASANAQPPVILPAKVAANITQKSKSTTSSTLSRGRNTPHRNTIPSKGSHSLASKPDSQNDGMMVTGQQPYLDAVQNMCMSLEAVPKNEAISLPQTYSQADFLDDNRIAENANKKARADADHTLPNLAKDSGSKPDFDVWKWMQSKTNDPPPGLSNESSNAQTTKPREGLTRQERIDWGLEDSPKDPFSSMAEDGSCERILSDKKPAASKSMESRAPVQAALNYSATLSLLNAASANAAAIAATAVADPAPVPAFPLPPNAIIPVKRKVGRPRKDSSQALATVLQKAAEKLAQEKFVVHQEEVAKRSKERAVLAKAAAAINFALVNWKMTHPLPSENIPVVLVHPAPRPDKGKALQPVQTLASQPDKVKASQPVQTQAPLSDKAKASQPVQTPAPGPDKVKASQPVQTRAPRPNRAKELVQTPAPRPDIDIVKASQPVQTPAPTLKVKRPVGRPRKNRDAIPAAQVASTEKTPTELIPSEEILTEKKPTEETPMEKIPIQETPMEKFRPEKIATENIPTEKTQTESILTEKIPSEKISTVNVPNEKAQTHKIPIEKTPEKTSMESKPPRFNSSPTLPRFSFLPPKPRAKLLVPMLSKMNEDLEIDEQEHRFLSHYYLTSEYVLLLSAMPHPWGWSPGFKAGELAWAEVPVPGKNGKSMLWPVQVLDRFVTRPHHVNHSMTTIRAVSCMSADKNQPILRDMSESGKELDVLNTVALNVAAASIRRNPNAMRIDTPEEVVESCDDPFDGCAGSVKLGTADGSRSASVPPATDIGSRGVTTPNGAEAGRLNNVAVEKLQQYQQQQQHQHQHVQKKQVGRPKTSLRNLFGTHVALKDPWFQADSEIDIGYVVSPLPMKVDAKTAPEGYNGILGGGLIERMSKNGKVAGCYYKKSTEMLPFYLINPECKEDIHWNVAVMNALDMCSSWAVPDALSDVLTVERDEVWSELVGSLRDGVEAKARNWGLQPATPSSVPERVRVIRNKVSADNVILAPELSLDERFLNVVRLGGERIEVGDLVRLTAKPIPAIGKAQRAVILGGTKPEMGYFYNIPPTDGHEYLEITHIIFRRPKIPAMTPWRTGKEIPFGSSPPYALRPAILLRGRIYYRIQACPQIGQISLWAPSSETRTINALNWDMLSRVHPQFPNPALALHFGYPRMAGAGDLDNAMVGGLVGRAGEIKEVGWEKDMKTEGLGPTVRKDLNDIDRLLGLRQRKRRRC